MVNLEKAEIALKLAIDASSNGSSHRMMLVTAKEFYDFLIGDPKVFSAPSFSEERFFRLGSIVNESQNS